ncbi:MAG TPA: hypothetical protein VK760_16530 [Candidatus Acidoferrales bacterium]|nr:hypothetical protein [Candidatus Acidoferrales bacterium]
MTSSLIRSGAAAVVAALAFAACAGNGAVPSSSLPNTADTLRTVAPAAANPCPIPVGWKFAGPCNPVKLTTAGGSGKLPAYKGFALTSTLGSNNSKPGTYLVFQDATGKGDITGTVEGLKFPKDKNAILYLAALNTSKKSFTFNVTPAIKITSKTAIKGKGCSLDQLGATKTGFAWAPSGITGTVATNGKSVSFPSLPVHQTVPAGTSGPFYLAFSCK